MNSITDLLDLEDEDIFISDTSIKDNVKTLTLNIFDKYVKLDRLPLSDIISVDEVFLNMDPSHKYALVIQDFHTGDPIDLLRSRKTNVTEPYFTSIPVEERYAVKYLLTDMYKPYLRYIDKLFPRAGPTCTGRSQKSEDKSSGVTKERVLNASKLTSDKVLLIDVSLSPSDVLNSSSIDFSKTISP